MCKHSEHVLPPMSQRTPLYTHTISDRKNGTGGKAGAFIPPFCALDPKQVPCDALELTADIWLCEFLGL